MANAPPAGSRSARSPAAAPSAFDELLSAEQELARGAGEEERACEALLARAQEEIAQWERGAAAELERELEQGAARAAAERAAAVRSIESSAGKLIQRYRALSAAEVARLAADLVAEATGLAAEPSP